MLKEYLKEKQVPFVEKLVDQDEKAQDEMAAISGGFMGVPFTVVEKDGKKQTITGFDKGLFNKVLGIS